MEKSAAIPAAGQGLGKKGARAIYRALLAYSDWRTTGSQKGLVQSIGSAFPGFNSLPDESKQTIANALRWKISPTKSGANSLWWRIKSSKTLAENITKTVNDDVETERTAIAKAQEKIRLETERKESELKKKQELEARVKHAQRPALKNLSIAALRERITGKKVLFVEDNEIILNALGMQFARLGAEVSLAMAGGTALNHASGVKFDVVVLDHNLLYELGTDVARQLRELYKESNPNAIFISYSASVQDVLEMPDATTLFNDFAPKPYAEVLASRIFEALSRQESLRQG
ncbi:MAG: response regulator [Candidatus Micrarchaeia archaeon]|jgi:CheY-like chemotaxis protein